MNLEDDRERSQTAAGLRLCRFPRCVCSSADALQQQLRGEAPPPYELGGDPNFDPTLHTLFNIQELVGGDVTELTSRGAEVQVTLLWAALLGTKLQKPT